MLTIALLLLGLGVFVLWAFQIESIPQEVRGNAAFLMFVLLLALAVAAVATGVV